MTNMMDYLLWRGDLSFGASGFCVVDAMILSCLAYLPFEQVVPEGFSAEVTLLQAAREMAAGKIPVGSRKNADLIRSAAKSVRFRNMMVRGCKTVFDTASPTQFAAVVFEPQPGLCFLAFRGTDDTLVGWKEDFDMSFAFPVPGQLQATDCLCRLAARRADCRIMLGGHSKGGNLAVYAGSFCGGDVQQRVAAAYNFDGPGFDHRLLQTDSYRSLAQRVHTFVPQSSVIGRLLEHEEEYTIVHSGETGLMQHDLFSWEVVGTGFVLLDQITRRGAFTDLTLRNWLEGMTDAQRANFFDGLYFVLQEANLTSLSQIREHWVESTRLVFKTLRQVEPQTRKDLSFALKLLLRSAKDGALATFHPQQSEEKTTDGKTETESVAN